MPKNEVLQCELAPGPNGGKNAPDGQEQKVKHPSGYPASQSALYGSPELDTLLPPIVLRTLYVIVFIELGTRRLIFANCTATPDSAWVTQQARNVAHEMQDLDLPVRFAIHDRDAKFTSGFDAVLESEGVEVIRTPFRAPRANSHCERSIGSARREFFDFMIVIGERHLRLLLDLWLDHYNRGRPHIALDLVAPDPRPTPATGMIVRERKLFGLTTAYSRAA